MTTDFDYIRKLETAREEKNQRIRQNPRSWIALSGLFWLQQGKNTVGCAPENPICIPQLKPHQNLELELQDTLVRFSANPDAEFTLRGTPVTEGILHSDHDSEPDILEVASISLMVIIRGSQTLLRVWDSESEQVRQFTGLRYFPIRPDYCLLARYVPFAEPVTRLTQDAIGNEEETLFVGEIIFTWQNVECHLLAQIDEDELLLNFTDLTRADSTYPAGRYLTIPKPTTEEIILDFNLAVNWPCAYTPYATCPIPLRENALPVRIEAGEMRYHTE